MFLYCYKPNLSIWKLYNNKKIVLKKPDIRLYNTIARTANILFI